MDTETTRSAVVEGLRDLADLLEKHSCIPTPTIIAMASMPAGHSFVDVLGLVEALAPCGIEESVVDCRREIVRRLGGVNIYVTVSAGAVGEVRPVYRHVPTFFVDSEVIKAGRMADSDA